MSANKYANRTKITVAQSLTQLDQLITKRGGKDFTFSRRDHAIQVGFRFDNTAFILEVPRSSEEEDARLFRVLIAVVKAKLIAIADGLTSFEKEFMPNIVTSDGRTIADHVLPLVESAKTSGKPLALGGGSK